MSGFTAGTPRRGGSHRPATREKKASTPRFTHKGPLLPTAPMAIPSPPRNVFGALRVRPAVACRDGRMFADGFRARDRAGRHRRGRRHGYRWLGRHRWPGGHGGNRLRHGRHHGRSRWRRGAGSGGSATGGRSGGGGSGGSGGGSGSSGSSGSGGSGGSSGGSSGSSGRGGSSTEGAERRAGKGMGGSAGGAAGFGRRQLRRRGRQLDWLRERRGRDAEAGCGKSARFRRDHFDHLQQRGAESIFCVCPTAANSHPYRPVFAAPSPGHRPCRSLRGATSP